MKTWRNIYISRYPKNLSWEINLNEFWFSTIDIKERINFSVIHRFIPVLQTSPAIFIFKPVDYVSNNSNSTKNTRYSPSHSSFQLVNCKRRTHRKLKTGIQGPSSRSRRRELCCTPRQGPESPSSCWPDGHRLLLLLLRPRLERCWSCRGCPRRGSTASACAAGSSSGAGRWARGRSAPRARPCSRRRRQICSTRRRVSGGCRRGHVERRVSSSEGRRSLSQRPAWRGSLPGFCFFSRGFLSDHSRCPLRTRFEAGGKLLRLDLWPSLRYLQEIRRGTNLVDRNLPYYKDPSF